MTTERTFTAFKAFLEDPNIPRTYPEFLTIIIA